jgi:hypothetical protein
MDGRVRKVEDFLKTRLLDTLSEQINKVFKVRANFLNTLLLLNRMAPNPKIMLGFL